MRIGMFSDSYLPYTSGVVRSVETFAVSLRRFGDAVYIAAPDFPGYIDADPLVFRFPSYRFSAKTDFRLANPFAWRVNRRWDGLGLDIIHSHSPFILGGAALKLSRRLRIPLVFTHHTMYAEYAHYFRWLPRSAAKRMIEIHMARYCDNADLIIAPTATVREMLVDKGAKRPIEILNTGVDLNEFRSPVKVDIRGRYGIKKNAPLLLFVGRLGLEKNLDALLEAVAPVLDAFPSARLMLIGDGPARGDLVRRAVDLGIERRTIFAGVMGRADTAAAYQAADLFVFSSLTETQGLVLSEAGAAGLPIVAMRAGGVEHMVNHGFDGLLTDPGSEALRAGVMRLLEDDELRFRFSKNATAEAERLSSKQKALELKGIYLKTLGLKERSGSARVRSDVS